MFLILIMGFIKTLAYYLLAIGCELVDPIICSLIFLLETPFTYLFETIFLFIVHNTMVYLGVVDIVVSVGVYIYTSPLPMAMHGGTTSKSTDPERRSLLREKKVQPHGAGTISKPAGPIKIIDEEEEI